jgi:two-component system chemotaxis response regulator CheY
MLGSPPAPIAARRTGMSHGRLEGRTARRGGFMGKKVIVVDDSRTARLQVSSVLSEAGYEIIEAVDGQDGIRKVGSHTDANLVLCDVNMPHMTGLEMLQAIRDKGWATPFVMLTTEAQPELVQQARERGAKGWIIKPFKPEHLLAAVRKLVGDTERGDG